MRTRTLQQTVTFKASPHQVYVDDRTIDSHVKRLRKKFKASDNEFDMIETLYGVGYRFKEL